MDDQNTFNTNGIVYDNSPWRPGRDIQIPERQSPEEDERRLKNLATKIMSNGVEVLVKDKSADGKQDQRKLKLMHLTSPTYISSSTPPNQSLLSSAVATVVNRQHISALFPLHQLLQHNYIIKTCMTTYTYLTTVVQNKRSAISTFETIVSVVTTESLTNLYASDVLADLKPTKTKYMEVKTIQSSVPSSIFVNNFPKIDKRIDNEDLDSFDLIQPSEVGHASCTTSCSCSHTKTEGLKTKYTHVDASAPSKYGLKTSKYGSNTKLDLRPTNKESLDKKTKYPYEYESNVQLAPTDKIVEKYTEVINDYSDEKDSSSVEESELLTNEQAPAPPKIKITNTKNPEKSKPEKPQKPNKNKFVVADLLKLGSLGIKSLSQLAPVIEKMTGGFIKRQDTNRTTSTSTTTITPAVKLTAYNVNKRVDTDIETKPNTFPIYIPVDELETSESQITFTNATLHQNLAWAAEHKQPKAHIVPPKIVHESPLVNGGIPISPGDIITANSDVIVGKPAVGGPLTLAASGIKLQNPVSPPPIDSFVAGNEEYIIKEKPSFTEQGLLATKVDDSYDLRPPQLPKPKPKPNRASPRPAPPSHGHHNIMLSSNLPHRTPSTINVPTDILLKTEQMKNTNTILGNHERPVFLDYIPALGKPTPVSIKHHVDFSSMNEGNGDEEITDNSPSSSEIVNTRVRTDDEYAINGNPYSSKPFLVDIQPSRVANVLIPHGSSTALVFAGSSEPHKTGDYVDDPLPYPEPGYFGSFSIDAPQMTNVHNVAPTSNKQFVVKPSSHTPLESYKPISPPYKEQPHRNDLKQKWKDNKRPYEFKIPPPTSNQETHLQVGPHITAYNPDIYKVSNGEFEKYNHVRGVEKPKNGKEVIDKEYENYLAVPPPPPPKMHHHHPESVYDKNKQHIQRPVVHTKPIQDMKVFLNIQHPVPGAPNHEQMPPKVTSEIYFAAQSPNNKPSPTYTIHIPPAQSPLLYGSSYEGSSNNVQHNKITNVNNMQTSNSFPVFSSTNSANKSVLTNEIHDKENTYTVTLNTATNVANNVGDSGQVIGSSVPVPVGITSNIGGQMNADIPIGTNFAIRVEDGPSPFESYNLQDENNNPTIVYKEPSHSYVEPPHSFVDISIGDNRWNKSTIGKTESKFHSNIPDTRLDKRQPANPPKPIHSISPSNSPTQNSHANFPMVNEYSTPGKVHDDVKPVTEYTNEVKINGQQKPKLIPNIPTNSHGWYSSVLMNENTLSNINNIKVEATTRKVIPLSQYGNKDYKPEFGQKITSVGKPPSEFWPQNGAPALTNFNVGKPFTKPLTEKPYANVPPRTTRPYNNINNNNNFNYISNFDSIRQPAYDIPVRDNSEETTTTKPVRATSEKLKPVYENSEEIYDGEEESESNGESDGEVSSESMKVPVVSASSETDVSKSSTEVTLLQDEVYEHVKETPKDVPNKNVQFVDFNPGTQTEKPFGSFNKTKTFQTNTIKPIYDSNPYQKPRPFTATSTTLDHQLQQPHWQINQLMENATNMSYEENLELNIGEEISTASSSSTRRPPSTQRIPPYRHTPPDLKYKRPPRPVFARPNAVNDSNNIITSTVHIQDKKPLIVEKATEKPVPIYTITHLDLNRTSSEIIDLSPPPPTMDYNFKPSTNDEMIMGMSPPPQRTPPAMRPPTRAPITPRPILPVRTPPPYKTKPPRINTLPPRIPITQRPVRKPINRDEVSTYRPAYDILNNVRRPVVNRDQPSSQLLPPPREIPSRVINPMSEMPPPTISASSVPNIVFPTPISSGWLTSSGVDFSSSFNFAPTSIHFPRPVEPSRVPDFTRPEIIRLENSRPEYIIPETPSSSENSYSYDTESSSKHVEITSSENPVNEDRVFTTTKETSVEAITHKTSTSTEENISDSVPNEPSQEDTTTDRMKVVPIANRNRTRKPYPVRNEEKKTTTSKYKLPPRNPAIITPTRTFGRPDIHYPSRHVTSIKKIVRPIPSRVTPESVPVIEPTTIIESSRPFIEEHIIKPTAVLEKPVAPTVSPLDVIDASALPADQPSISSIITPSLEDIPVSVRPIHHAGNEIKISDEAIPTKTEFRTAVITLTKTLSELPKTVSSVNYLNLTHTLTVTRTETSLISQSEGAITQTLVLTNTQTSTIVDIVTETHTQVQPTTIIETVTKHIPIVQVSPTPVKEIPAKTQVPLDDISMSYEDNDNLIIKDKETTENIQKIDEGEGDNDTFFVVMNKSQNGGQAPPIGGATDIETGDYDGVTRNEQVNSNGVSQVLFGEILLAGTPYLETTNVVHAPGGTYGKECQPDCKASRNERCQRIDGVMKCVCRPGFARMFPDRPCKPTYTYSVKLALGTQGNARLLYHDHLSDNSSKQYHELAVATHEGINRMVMQSDLRDVYHGVHITGFHPVEVTKDGEGYQGVMNDFFVQLSDNAHESRLKEVIEKYLRNNNYSLGGTDVHAAADLVDKLDVSDFDECVSGQFHDCSEHAQCFNLRGTYTCSCLEGFADLSVNNLYPGRICSAEPVGCERCNYHGACYSRDDRRVLCECFQWYAGSSCQINLKVVLISLVVAGALLSVVLAVCAVVACSRPRREQRSIVACIQSMPSLHQGAMPSKQRADRRALISERPESGDASSVQNASLPYMPAKRAPQSAMKKCVMSAPPAHDAPPPPPAPAVMIPRARLHPHHADSRENISKKLSLELSSEAKLISYLESGAVSNNEEMRRKHSMESSYSGNKDRHNKQGALVSAGFKVSTTIRPDEALPKEDRDDLSSVHKVDLEADLARFDSLRKSYSQEDISEWTDAERRLGELTLSEARSVGGTLPASTGRAASSTRLTHQEANTMAERDLGSTFLLPHVHLYKPDLTSDVSEFDSL